MKKELLFLIGLFLYGTSNSQNALLIPPTLTGTNISLTLQEGTKQFYAGQITETMGANGDVLGPTLILNQGDLVNFSVDNQIADTTTIHWHGLHVSPENDGGPHTTIAPNSTWNPSFTILDKAATYWYHPHLHHFTNKHVTRGIAGLIIVKDNEEALLNLPREYGIDDFPIILQTKDFDSNNQILVHSNADNVAMVNATLDPFLDVPAQVIRYRILNGSSQRAFNLGLSNGQFFYQIASDGGLLSSPYQTTRLLLAPGERAEILIDFNSMEGQNVFLNSYASELQNGIYGGTSPGMNSGMVMTGYYPNVLNGSDFNLLEFNIGNQTASPVLTIPSTLVSLNPLLEANSDITRSLTFSPEVMGFNQLDGIFLINSTSLDMSVVNYTIPINNTEIWELTNMSAISHPFHIHDVQFNILTRNGVLPPVNEQGRKDVVLVKPQETVRFIAKFEDFADEEIPYMYHCHLLTHEDDGMMGQFIVKPDSVEISDTTNTSLNILLENTFNIYPNPTNNYFDVRFKENFEESIEIKVLDVLGRSVFNTSTIKNKTRISTSDWAKGIYSVFVSNKGRTFMKKISKLN